MSRNEFLKLTISEKTEQLWMEGEFISEKVYYDNNISLFVFEGFFVEVFFNRNYNEITGIEIQENDQILFGYVKDLELNVLLE
jgi:hypothetical protein